MRYKIFQKRVLPFFTTFIISLFISNLHVIGKLPEKPAAEDEPVFFIPERQRSCEPAKAFDFNKYEKFSGEELFSELIIKLTEREKLNLERKDEKNLTSEENGIYQIKIEDLNKEIFALNELIDLRDGKTENLLHRENCYEF